MARANTDNSTTMPVDSTRRRFLSQAAGVAAGGTVLAMAAIPPASAAAAPASALASGEPDPIFALIETHRTAAEVYSAACLEQSRREEILIEEGTGLCPFATVSHRGSPQVCHTHEQIDAYGQRAGEQVRGRAHAALDAAQERIAAIMGDAKRVNESACDVASDAFDDLVTTPPTSMAGLRALLTYLSGDVVDLGQQLDAYKSEMLIHSIYDALMALNPSGATEGMV